MITKRKFVPSLLLSLFSSIIVFIPCLLEYTNFHWSLKWRERCGREIIVELVTLYIEDVSTRVITQEITTCLRVGVGMFMCVY